MLHSFAQVVQVTMISPLFDNKYQVIILYGTERNDVLPETVGGENHAL